MASRNAKINIIVDGLRQVQALEKSLRSISSLADKVNGTGGGSNVNKTLQQETKIQRILNQIETKRNQILQLDVKNAKVSAAKGRLTKAENLANKGKIAEAEKELAIGTKRLTILKGQTAELQRQAKFAPSSALNFDKGSGRLLQGRAGSSRNTRANLLRRFGPTRGFDTQSALIGGGFPLLFGGGPLQAAAGALGGGIGGMFGKMGGFAGSIAATAIVQTIQQAVTAISELGQALGPFTQNTQAVVNSLGLQGSAQQAQIKLIEQVEGKTAAFNAAINLMAREIGQSGVDALKEFGETSRLAAGEFARLGLHVQAVAAKVLNFTNEILGLTDALEKTESRDLVAAAAEGGNAEAKALFTERQSQGFFSKLDNAINNTFLGRISQMLPGSAGLGGAARGLSGITGQKSADDDLSKRERFFAVGEKIRIQADQLTLEFAQHAKKIQEKADLEEEVARLMAGGMKQSVAEQIAQNNVLADQARKRLEVELEILKAKIADPDIKGKKLTDATVAYNTIKKALQDIGVEQEKLNKLTEIFGNKVKKVKVTKEEIANLLANEMTNALMGLIEGTKSLGESLASIAKSLANMFLNAAFQNIFNRMFNITGGAKQAQGAYNRAGSFKAFQYGGVVNSPTLGMIGEGGEPEYVIPASKMDGAMARYSAGARGGAVIPGGSHGSSTVAGGSGNAIVEYTGPVLNFNGDEYVPKTAVPEIINTAARRGGEAGQAKAFATLKNSRSQRATLGL